jgi:hypothetical protein
MALQSAVTLGKEILAKFAALRPLSQVEVTTNLPVDSELLLMRVGIHKLHHEVRVTLTFLLVETKATINSQIQKVAKSVPETFELVWTSSEGTKTKGVYKNMTYLGYHMESDFTKAGPSCVSLDFRAKEL